jgi:hypothetical protein
MSESSAELVERTSTMTLDESSAELVARASTSESAELGTRASSSTLDEGSTELGARASTFERRPELGACASGSTLDEASASVTPGSKKRRVRTPARAMIERELAGVSLALDGCFPFGHAELTFSLRVAAGVATLQTTTPVSMPVQRCFDRVARRLDFGDASFTTKILIKETDL